MPLALPRLWVVVGILATLLFLMSRFADWLSQSPSSRSSPPQTVPEPLPPAAAAPFSPDPRPRATVDDRVREFCGSVRQRWASSFERVGLSYPPAALALVALKEERVLEVHGAAEDGAFRQLRALPILGASGALGPKLREGDLQVPEGIYQIESLNPNSLFHLSLRVSYPNEFDRAQAAREERTELGGDIMIHGGTESTGCLAVGDEAAEDLFVLAALTGLPNITVLISPLDLRFRELPEVPPAAPPWTPELHRDLKSALEKFPSAPTTY